MYNIELKGICKGEKTKGEREKENLFLHCSYFRFLHHTVMSSLLFHVSLFLFYIRKQTHQQI